MNLKRHYEDDVYEVQAPTESKSNIWSSDLKITFVTNRNTWKIVCLCDL